MYFYILYLNVLSNILKNMPSMIQFWCDSYVWHPIDFFVICDHKIFQIAYNLKRFVSAINFLLCVEKLRIKKKKKVFVSTN